MTTRMGPAVCREQKHDPTAGDQPTGTWCSAEALSSCADTLIAGEVLTAGDQLDAPAHRLCALMRGDGNLVVYRTDDWSVVWSSGTAGHPEATALMQDDGDLAIIALDGSRVWSSATGGHPGGFLQLHDDGTLAVYSFYRELLWSSGSLGPSQSSGELRPRG